MSEEKRSEILARITVLEAELGVLRRQLIALGGSDVEAVLASCRDLVRQGKPVEAVKHYRSSLGTSLKEAYDAVMRSSE